VLRRLRRMEIARAGLPKNTVIPEPEVPSSDFFSYLTSKVSVTVEPGPQNHFVVIFQWLPPHRSIARD